MLIDAGKEKHILTFKPVITGSYVDQQHFVSVPDMRQRVRVINCGGDEKRLRHFVYYLYRQSVTVANVGSHRAPLRYVTTVATRLWRVQLGRHVISAKGA